MPPEAPACLSTPYSAKPGQRGGTLIDEEVADLATHRARLADPDGYRPKHCPTCSYRGVVHAHDFRFRRLRAHLESREEEIRRYRCPGCGAVWQVLPAVVARYLHRTWDVVQSALVKASVLGASGAERRVSVPARSLRRWASRLLLSAALLVQVLSDATAAIVDVVTEVGVVCTRAALIESLARLELIDCERKLDHFAGWLHRLVPGVRLL